MLIIFKQNEHYIKFIYDDILEVICQMNNFQNYVTDVVIKIMDSSL